MPIQVIAVLALTSVIYVVGTMLAQLLLVPAATAIACIARVI